MEALKGFFSLQKDILKIIVFETEYEIMKKVIFEPENASELIKDLSFKWFETLFRDESKDDEKTRIEKSQKYREEGNKLYLMKGKDRKLLDACSYYTKAILIAPTDTEALAIAHANRAAVLQEFGYYQQAYDDCVCALEQSYPVRLLHKILTRQAFCAWKLCDVAQLQLHLKTLDKLELNINFVKQKQELQSHLHELMNNTKKCEENLKQKQEHEIELKRDKQKIVDSNDSKGRYLIATEEFRNNEIIFGCRASSFVPVKTNRICHECGNSQLIPFPCYLCYGHVVYCSLKCRNAHKNLHEFECPGIQVKFFENIGIAHLATRIVIENLPKIINELEQKQNAKEMWHELTDNVCNIKSEMGDYAETLKLKTIFFKKDLDDIIVFALIAKTVVFYLKMFTKFFNLFPIDKIELIEWELITGTLILRHMGQMMLNAHTINSIVIRPSKLENTLDFSLIDEQFWHNPYRVKLGQLHNFSCNEVIAVANIPYLSILNHSCQQAFQPKFSGRYMGAYALRDIKPNEEISNCYLPDYRKSKMQQRCDELLEYYNFKCDCQKCTKFKPDEDYERFHRYRCEKYNCRKEFTPYLPNLRNLDWWTNETTLSAGIKCTFCGMQQDYYWLPFFFNQWLRHAKNPTMRRNLYNKINEMEQWMVDYNEMKTYLSLCTLRECVDAHFESEFLKDDEFKILIDIVKYLLKATAAQNCKNSIEYVAIMTYLWDFIALGKVKCSQSEMQEMLQTIEIISNEYKTIFINYYNDFIKEQII